MGEEAMSMATIICRWHQLEKWWGQQTGECCCPGSLHPHGFSLLSNQGQCLGPRGGRTGRSFHISARTRNWYMQPVLERMDHLALNWVGLVCKVEVTGNVIASD